jgi:chorismate mutase
MKKRSEEKFFLVHEDVLPDAMKKTLEVKTLMEQKGLSVSAATLQADLSRSAFYKYRDMIFPFQAMVKEQIVTIFLTLEDRSGTLSKILTIIAAARGNVLTIHQTIPLQGLANVTLSISTSEMEEEVVQLISNLKKLEFVLKADIVGSGA